MGRRQREKWARRSAAKDPAQRFRIGTRRPLQRGRFSVYSRAVTEDEGRRRAGELVHSALARPGSCLFLTGAGVSAESGVPTFRGKDGYWQVGSRNYHAAELATRAQFARTPAAVWGWYLHRLRVCRAASPNPAHRAIAELGAALGEAFLLITQNVDGLHARAGSPSETTYEIHGNISRMRCSAGCPGASTVPEALLAPGADADEAGLERALACPVCAAWMRPHVLWFDEFYDEELFRFDSSLAALSGAALLCVIGTTGTTNLPAQIGAGAAQRGVPMLVINPEPNPFSELALARGGLFLQGQAGRWVPELARQIRAAVDA
jgi:NAD-dependent deacetylase